MFVSSAPTVHFYSCLTVRELLAVSNTEYADTFIHSSHNLIILQESPVKKRGAGVKDKQRK